MVDNWQARAQQVLAGGPGTFSKSASRYPQSLVPQALVRGDGAYVWGDDGRKYLDTVSALGAVLLGHANPIVNQAIMAQLACGTSFSMLHPLEVEVAELLCDMLPCAEMVRFCRNGTDATNIAVRLARAVTGKQHAVFVGYSGGGMDSYGITTDKAAGILPQLAPYNHQIAWGDFTSLEYADIKAYRAIVHDDGTELADDMACLMIEVPSLPWGASDTLIATTVQQYRQWAHAHGALFILDEIVTWPREGLQGYQGRCGILPDLCCVSKAIANGLPLAALCGQRQYMERLNHGDIFMSWTFAGETTALAAAKAVITTLRHTDALDTLWCQGQVLGDGLQALFRQYDLPVQLLGTPARLAVRWQDVHGVATALELRTLWLAELARRGILAGTGVIFPMVAYTDVETQAMLTAAEEVCALIGPALGAGRVQEALPCAVIQDVLAVR